MGVYPRYFDGEDLLFRRDAPFLMFAWSPVYKRWGPHNRIEAWGNASPIREDEARKLYPEAFN